MSVTKAKRLGAKKSGKPALLTRAEYRMTEDLGQIHEDLDLTRRQSDSVTVRRLPTGLQVSHLNAINV